MWAGRGVVTGLSQSNPQTISGAQADPSCGKSEMTSSINQSGTHVSININGAEVARCQLREDTGEVLQPLL